MIREELKFPTSKLDLGERGRDEGVEDVMESWSEGKKRERGGLEEGVLEVASFCLPS
jgi:hypothetical protein